MKLKKIKILECVFFLLGLFSTTPIIGISIGKKYITLFNIFFVLTFIISFIFLILKKQKTSKIDKIDKNVKYIFMFFYCEIIAALIGLIVLPESFNSTIVSYLFKSIEYMFLYFMILFFSPEEKELIIKSFLKGFFLGCIANAIWALVQAFFWFTQKKAINTLLFKNAIVEKNHVGLFVYTDYGIRVSGLNTDPAHLGAILPILFFYSSKNKNIILIILTLVALSFSGSTTALVTILTMFFYNIIKVNYRHIIFNKKTIIKFLVCIIIFAIGILIFKDSSLVKTISKNMNGFLYRVSDVYVESEDVTPREIYYKNAISELFRRWKYALFGTGFGTSGYAYYDIPMAVKQGVYDVESTYLSYVFDIGIIGFIIYIILLYKSYKKINNSDEKYKILLMGCLLSTIIPGFFYHYIITSYQIITLFLIAVISKKKDVKE